MSSLAHIPRLLLALAFFFLVFPSIANAAPSLGHHPRQDSVSPRPLAASTTTTTTSATGATSSSTTLSSSSSGSSTTTSVSTTSSTSSSTESTTSLTSKSSSEATSTSSTISSSAKTTSSSSLTTSSKSSASVTTTSTSSTSPTLQPNTLNAAQTSTSTSVFISQGTGTSIDTPETTEAPNLSSASKKGFWDNKGAVAGVFVPLSLLSAGLIVVLFMRSRNRRKREQRHTDFFERFPASPRAFSPETAPSGVTSMTDLHQQTPMSAYPNRDIHQDNVHPHPVETVNYSAQSYGLEYPPGTTAAGYNNTQQTYDYGNNTQRQSQNPYHSPTYLSPSNTDPFAGDPAPRPTPGRSTNPFRSNSPGQNPERVNSGYQQSLDSFYGAPGNAGVAL